jgi:hypothetical protein
MGYSKSKTIERDSISGHYQHIDGGLQNGTLSPNEVSARTEARAKALIDSIKADSDGPDETTLDHPAYGNSLSRQPKPSDYSSKGADHYGVSETPGKQEKTHAPRDNSKVSR